MSKKFNFDQIIDRAHTDSLKWDLRSSMKMDDDVLPMWVADMDFQTDSAIIEQLTKQVAHGIFGYTLENPAYKESLVGWLKRRHQTIIKPEHIMTTPGVISGISAAIQVLTKPKEKVAIFTPVYHPFKTIVEKNERTIVAIPLLVDEHLHYQIDFEAFEQSIKSEAVKVLIFCTPHNPIGRVWSKDELHTVAKICQKHHVWILSDDIHMDFIFKGYQHHLLIGLDPNYRSFVITFVSATKTFNLAATALSQLIIFDETVKQQIQLLYDQIGIHMHNHLGLLATTVAFEQGDHYVNQLVPYIKENVDYVVDFLEQEIPIIKATPQQGLYVMWLDCHQLGLSQRELVRFFSKQAKIWVHSGELFGESGKGFIRMNVATPKSNVMLAMERLKQALIEASFIRV